MRSATWRIRSSPASWPSVSLTCLKRSRSIIRRAMPWGPRRAAATAMLRRSSNRARLASPVSLSWKAMCWAAVRDASIWRVERLSRCISTDHHGQNDGETGQHGRQAVGENAGAGLVGRPVEGGDLVSGLVEHGHADVARIGGTERGGEMAAADQQFVADMAGDVVVEILHGNVDVFGTRAVVEASAVRGNRHEAGQGRPAFEQHDVADRRQNVARLPPCRRRGRPASRFPADGRRTDETYRGSADRPRDRRFHPRCMAKTGVRLASSRKTMSMPSFS